MEKPYIKLNIYRTPPDLTERVIFCLRECERRREKRRLVIFSVVALGALSALVPSLESVGALAAKSGFSSYASLLFSDWSAVASIWKTFALSLAETAPLFAIVTAAAILFVLVWSSAEAIRYTRALRLSLG